MPTDAKKPTSASQAPPSQNAALFVFSTIADTTWRIFLPVLICVLAGWWLDEMYNTVPWLLLVGTILGGLISGSLVYQQMKRGLK